MLDHQPDQPLDGHRRAGACVARVQPAAEHGRLRCPGGGGRGRRPARAAGVGAGHAELLEVQPHPEGSLLFRGPDGPCKARRGPRHFRALGRRPQWRTHRVGAEDGLGDRRPRTRRRHGGLEKVAGEDVWFRRRPRDQLQDDLLHDVPGLGLGPADLRGGGCVLGGLPGVRPRRLRQHLRGRARRGAEEFGGRHSGNGRGVD
mmetsp:Transcript_52710/g.171399  ORF Transcript_52710/g.171399 Transcript_52710/m.171399 type:complete len:202 (-) Transcript_52710:533-1138(-)